MESFSYDVWVPPKQHPIRAGAPATQKLRWRKEFGPVTLTLGRKICALYHRSNRDAMLILHRPRARVGKTYWLGAGNAL